MDKNEQFLVGCGFYFVCDRISSDIEYAVVVNNNRKHLYILEIKSKTETKFKEDTNTIIQTIHLNLNEKIPIIEMIDTSLFNYTDEGGLNFSEKLKRDLFLKCDIYITPMENFIKDICTYSSITSKIAQFIRNYEEKPTVNNTLFNYNKYKSIIIFVLKDEKSDSIDLAVILNKRNFKCFYSNDDKLENWSELYIKDELVKYENENIDGLYNVDISFIIKEKLKSEKINKANFLSNDFIIIPIEESIKYRKYFMSVINKFKEHTSLSLLNAK